MSRGRHRIRRTDLDADELEAMRRERHARREAWAATDPDVIRYRAERRRHDDGTRAVVDRYRGTSAVIERVRRIIAEEFGNGSEAA